MSTRKSAARRCDWAAGNELLARYHDLEWGVPIRDDARQFEFLVLESAQAGLSWLTVLRKRENYRRAFAGFDPERVARFNSRHVERLLGDAGIIRNRRKIEAAVQNARQFLEIQQEFGSFSAYIWSFVDGKPVQNKWKLQSQLPVTSPASDALAKDMKRRGFKFLGSTVLYAHMQATGMVNDHLQDCFRHKICRQCG